MVWTKYNTAQNVAILEKARVTMTPITESYLRFNL